jgi:hypothetical protein
LKACLATKEVIPDLLAVLFNYFAVHDLFEFNPEACQRLAILGLQPYRCFALAGREDFEVRTASMIPHLLLKVE